MFKKRENGFDIILNGSEVISGAALSVNLCDRNENEDLGNVIPEIESFSENEIVFKYEDFLKIVLSGKQSGEFGYLSVDAEIVPNVIMGQHSFAFGGAIEISFEKLFCGEKFVCTAPSTSWWIKPNFVNSEKEITKKSISVGIKGKTETAYFLTLPTDSAKSDFTGNKLVLRPGFLGCSKISGAFLCFAAAKNLFDASNILFENAFAEKIINIPSKEERGYPEMFKYFGWCSWNAFYHDVTHGGLISKLEEFKEKEIPMKWILIDDGWSCYEGDKLTSLKEDYEKFPQGLDGFVKEAKEKYGTEFIGVWHAFLGYWLGIKEGSEVHIEQSKNIKKFNSGIVLPDCSDSGKVFEFFNTWHRFLKEKGIDFLKVDVQGSLKNYVSGDMSPVLAAKNMAEGLDASVCLNFDGKLINCMGVTQENIFSRPKTSLTRNSDDFFPTIEGSFANHLKQNAFVSLFHDKLYHLDWDMWWTNQGIDSVKSGVLRAISGGPVYISDKVGDTDPDMILPIIEDDGLILMCDNAAVPSADTTFDDPEKSGKLIKLVNTVGENGVMALFNISESKKDASATVKVSDIYGINPDADYVVYSYFEKKYYYITRGEELEFNLGFDEVEILNFYPVKNDFILLGDTSKYISSASKNKTKIPVDELVF